MQMAIGQIPFKLVINESVEFDIIMKTMYAPRTITRIERALPFSTLGVIQDDALIIVFDDLIAPKEYTRSKFTKGEISFDPSSNNLAIYLKDSTTKSDLTLLGSISSSFEELDNITDSSRITFTLNE
jgi:hypothetical protein